MPVMKCPNGKWKIGEHGKCVFDTEAQAKKGYIAYLLEIHRQHQRERGEPVMSYPKDRRG